MTFIYRTAVFNAKRNQLLYTRYQVSMTFSHANFNGGISLSVAPKTKHRQQCSLWRRSAAARVCRAASVARRCDFATRCDKLRQSLPNTSSRLTTILCTHPEMFEFIVARQLVRLFVTLRTVLQVMTILNCTLWLCLKHWSHNVAARQLDIFLHTPWYVSIYLSHVCLCDFLRQGATLSGTCLYAL